MNSNEEAREKMKHNNSVLRTRYRAGDAGRWATRRDGYETRM